MLKMYLDRKSTNEVLRKVGCCKSILRDAAWYAACSAPENFNNNNALPKMPELQERRNFKHDQDVPCEEFQFFLRKIQIEAFRNSSSFWSFKFLKANFIQAQKH